eukprot:TRINITY_DN8981_c0_g2_i1.p1 TRINITY_DN8981_c0_g2~~TRINITY_DN8981_c0_g2_i1.p1  ORF type:complete len:431 (+),score=84.69 TRINITY_DN8981_c0_g2_i1:126-1418(+)
MAGGSATAPIQTGTSSGTRDATQLGFGAAAAPLKPVVETDALIESSFRRLLASIENERDQIRGSWQRLQQVRDGTTQELSRLRQETEDWCYDEKQKIDGEWERLDKLSVQMNSLWPAMTEVLEINCGGQLFTIPKSTLCQIEGSVLSEMFSDDFIMEIPRDEEGRFFLDFNRECFGYVVEYLRNRRLKADAPLPTIPTSQARNMEVLAEAWKLIPFLKFNKINPLHGTSLSVKKAPRDPAFGPEPGGEFIKATHTGWQVVSAEAPLPQAAPSYFEMKIENNPDTRGGLAMGVCGHIPQGSEVHSIRLQGVIMYNSNNGLIGDAVGMQNVETGIKMQKGETLGIRHDVLKHVLQFFHNGRYIGSCQIKKDKLEMMEELFPVFALYVPDQHIFVDFRAATPTIPQEAMDFPPPKSPKAKLQETAEEEAAEGQ